MWLNSDVARLVEVILTLEGFSLDRSRPKLVHEEDDDANTDPEADGDLRIEEVLDAEKSGLGCRDDVLGGVGVFLDEVCRHLVHSAIGGDVRNGLISDAVEIWNGRSWTGCRVMMRCVGRGRVDRMCSVSCRAYTES